MPNDASDTEFQSMLAPLMDQFVEEKHACGYAYREPTRILHRLDDFLVQESLTTLELPRSLARKWLAKKPHESARTQQQRIILVRHFSRFLLRAGYPAYVPESTLAARNPATFVPRMLTDEELGKFFRAVDALEPTARSPLRHLTMPEVFRLNFLMHYLGAQRNLSPNTIKAYRDVFTLLLRFCRDVRGIAPEKLVWLFLGWTLWLASGHAPQETSGERGHVRCAECGGTMRIVAVFYEPYGALPEHSIAYLDSG